MSDAVLVLDAGSSSIKFSVFVVASASLELAFHGQVEGLYTSAHFVAKTLDGARLSEKSWEPGGETRSRGGH